MISKAGKWLIGTSLTGAMLLLLDALFLEKYFFELKTFKIGSRRSYPKLRLLLLTDLHFRKSLWPFHYRLARKINQLAPDLIMISGDALDSSGKTGPMEQFLSLLQQDIPKVAIPGNHDHKARPDIKTLYNLYQKYNGTLLLNASKEYLFRDKKVVVTGVDDFIEGNDRFEKAVKGVGKEDHHLLLVHSPLQQELVKQKIQAINKARSAENQLNIRYIFAGHNHGGQIRAFGLVPKLPVKSGDYVNGWYNSESPYLYVSKGFGTSTIPFRFGARSEITLFYWG